MIEEKVEREQENESEDEGRARGWTVAGVHQGLDALDEISFP
jgi:hypothetical protein